MKVFEREKRVWIAALLVVAVAALAVTLAACGKSKSTGSSSNSPAPSGGTSTINGAGATFPFPLYTQWAKDYQNVSGSQVNYQGIGSGAGIAQIKAKTVDFGATDAPLKAAELDSSGLLQFPMCVGGDVLVVNLKGVAMGSLKLTADLVAKIYMGQITKWDDPAIKAVNPGLSLPATPIAVVHRSDSSGTTWIFTNYLTAAAPSVWKPGAGKAVQWPTGVGGKGNDGVAANVKQINGAIGYVEYAYAAKNGMNYTQLQNKDGKFVSPSLATFAAATAGADWAAAAPTFYLVLVDQAGPDSWPITGASFILVQKNATDAGKAKDVLSFFDWAYKNGQTDAKSLFYVSMPSSVVDLVEQQWSQVTVSGTPVWP
jgi:phosphate transport system substrate-binding protein